MSMSVGLQNIGSEAHSVAVRPSAMVSAPTESAGDSPVAPPGLSRRAGGGSVKTRNCTEVVPPPFWSVPPLSGPALLLKRV